METGPKILRVWQETPDHQAELLWNMDIGRVVRDSAVGDSLRLLAWACHLGMWAEYTHLSTCILGSPTGQNT